MSFASGCGDLVGVKCNPLLQSPLVSAVPQCLSLSHREQLLLSAWFSPGIPHWVES